MEIRAKGGLVLFVILTALLLLNLYRGLSSVKSKFNSNEIIIDSLLLLFPLIICLTIIFLIATYYTDKKIKNKSFSYEWLAKFNFIFLIASIIFFEIVGTLLIILELKLTNAHPDAGLIVFAWWRFAPILTLIFLIIFSIIPSIIIYKIYNKKNILRTILFQQ
jgi:hypothetical protein